MPWHLKIEYNNHCLPEDSTRLQGWSTMYNPSLGDDLFFILRRSCCTMHMLGWSVKKSWGWIVLHTRTEVHILLNVLLMTSGIAQARLLIPFELTCWKPRAWPAYLRVKLLTSRMRDKSTEHLEAALLSSGYSAEQSSEGWSTEHLEAHQHTYWLIFWTIMWRLKYRTSRGLPAHLLTNLLNNHVKAEVQNIQIPEAYLHTYWLICWTIIWRLTYWNLETDLQIFVFIC